MGRGDRKKEKKDEVQKQLKSKEGKRKKTRKAMGQKGAPYKGGVKEGKIEGRMKSNGGNAKQSEKYGRQERGKVQRNEERNR